MDDITKSMIAEAFELANECKRAEERYEWLRQRRQEQQETTSATLHYRVQEDALIQKQADDLGDYVTHDELESALGTLADAIGSEMGKIDREMLDGLQAQISDLRNQIAALQSKSGSVTPIRGKQNVA